MAESQTKGQIINTWTQTIALIVAAMWGGWSLYFDKIELPESAPVNISLKLEIKKIKTTQPLDKSMAHLVPIEVKIAATNPSSRIVDLLPNIWVAYGRKIEPVNPWYSNTTFFSDAVTIPNSNSTDVVSKYIKYSSVLIANGKLFSDYNLKPNETISRVFLFYAPTNKFDSVAITTQIPTVTKKNSEARIYKKVYKKICSYIRQEPEKTYQIRWNLNKSGSYYLDYQFSPQIFGIYKGERNELKKDNNNQYIDSENEIQTSNAKYVLSLR